MRLAAAGLLSVLAAFFIAQRPIASADQSSPFPSPSPSASAGPGSGGYALAGVMSLNGSGGFVPASPTPAPFQAAGSTGYELELLGRLSDSYLALLHFEDVNIHGDDSSVESRLDVNALYQFSRTQTAIGLGYAALQRSTAHTTSSGLGLGLAVLPDFAHRMSPYASAFFYPSLPSATSRGGLTVLQAGLALSAPGTSGLFARVGFSSQNFSAASFSPRSLSGVELGVGVTF